MDKVRVMRVLFLFFFSPLAVISRGFISNFQITTLRHASKTNKPRLVQCLRRTSAASCKENCVFLFRINKLFYVLWFQTVLALIYFRYCCFIQWCLF